MHTMEENITGLLKKNERDRVMAKVNTAVSYPKTLGKIKNSDSLTRCITHIEQARQELQRKDLLPNINLILTRTEALLHQRVDSSNQEATAFLNDQAKALFSTVINQHLITKEFCETYGMSSAKSISKCTHNGSWLARELHTQLKNDFEHLKLDRSAFIESYRQMLIESEMNPLRADQIVDHIQGQVKQKIKDIVHARSASFNQSVNAAFKPWKRQFSKCRRSPVINRMVDNVLAVMAKNSASKRIAQHELNKQLSENLTDLINKELNKRGRSELSLSRSIFLPSKIKCCCFCYG